MPSQRTPLVLAGTILLFVGVGVWLVFFPAKPGIKPPPQDEDSISPVRPLPTEGIKLKAKQLATAFADKVSQANAADLYRQAFTLIDTLSTTDLNVVADWQAAVDPAVAAELCTRLKPICALAHKAAATTNCDWDVSHAPLTLPLPAYLSASRSLTHVLLWNAAHCRQTDSAGIGEDLAATVRLAQAVAKPPLLISHLANVSFQSRVINFLALNATALPNNVSAQVAQLLADDQSTTALAGIWETEASTYNGLADKFAGLSPEQAQTALQNLVGESTAQYSQTQAIAALRLVAELETEYAQALAAPDPEYQAWLDRSKAQRQANPLMDLILPPNDSMDGVLRQTQTLAVKRALLVAGLAYLQGEPDALANHPDPTSSTPFVPHQTDAGLELQSSYATNGVPLTMFFPKR